MWSSSSFSNSDLPVYDHVNASGESLPHFKCPLRYKNLFLFFLVMAGLRTLQKFF